MEKSAIFSLLSFFLSFSSQSEELFDFRKELKVERWGKATLLLNLVGEERMSLLLTLIVLRRNIQSEDGKIAHARRVYKVLSEMDRKLSKSFKFIIRVCTGLFIVCENYIYSSLLIRRNPSFFYFYRKISPDY